MARSLWGTHERSFDKKQRVQIPSDFRETVGENEKEKPWVVTLGPKRCTLSLYPTDRFEELADRMELEKRNDPEVRRVELQFLGTAFSVDPDDQGRVVIPERLRKKAGLEGTVMLVGQRNRVDLYSKTLYEQELGIDWDGDDWPELDRILFSGRPDTSSGK